MSNYTLWTIDPETFEMDRPIHLNIGTFAEAEARACAYAGDLDKPILILRDGEEVTTIYPEVVIR